MAEIILCFLAGGLIGAWGMHQKERRARMQELSKVEGLLQDLLDEREIHPVCSGEETLYARMEHQIVRIQRIVVGRRDEAEQNKRKIQELISEIAHQMRTPLANMRTYRELLEDLPEEPKEARGQMQRSVSAIRQSEEKLQFLVESFVRMSRLEQGIIQIKRTEPDLLKTICNALGQVQNQAEQKKIEFVFDLPGRVKCIHDANWAQEALYNLLDNAVKYSPEGGRIKVSLQEGELFFKICVRDYGIGIEEEETNLIFQRFYRGKRVGTQTGLGIGLYLAREIAYRHGGLLTARRMEPGLQMEFCLGK